MIQQTLSIIKPDATRRNLIGNILSHLESNGLTIKAIKRLHLTREQAEGFYAEHKDKDFFEPLVTFMTSAPIVVSVLEGENAVQHYRDLMGATDPAKREKGTIRDKFALSYRENSVHGSDSEASAKREIAYFFVPSEIV